MHDIRIDLHDTGREGVEGIHVAQDRDKWRAIVKAAINVWGPSFISRGRNYVEEI
jgi:trehalose/maltose hydrolase-like predicted phosphorylase